MKSSPRVRGAEVPYHLLRCDEGLSVGTCFANRSPSETTAGPWAWRVNALQRMTCRWIEHQKSNLNETCNLGLRA
jgi:hypothetical protein